MQSTWSVSVVLSAAAFFLSPASAAEYENVLVPNPEHHQYTRVAGLNERGEVLTESPEDRFPYPSCQHIESRVCAAAVWSEKEGRIEIPPQFLSGYFLNDRGEVGGFHAGAGANGYLFVWTPDTGVRDFAQTTALRCPTPLVAAFDNHSEMAGNDCANPTGGFFVSPGEELRYLEGASRVQPRAMNDKGEIVGDSAAGAFYWSERTGFIDIRERIGAATAAATAINNTGLVLGEMTNSAGDAFWFLWDLHRGLETTFAKPPSCTALLASSGDVVGKCGGAGDPSRLWMGTPNEGMHDVANLGYDAQVNDVNDHLEVVGAYRSAPGAALHAFVWSAKNGLVDLDPENPERISDAKYINDHGVIAGEFEYPGPYYSASSAACVWEPSRP